MIMKKYLSQTQVVSVVLITGIALILASTAYYWGMPLIEKTRKSIEMEASENSIFDLVDAIEEVMESGNTKTLEISLNGRFVIDTENDEIIYEIKTPSPSYFVASYIPLNDIPPFRKYIIVFKDGERKEVPLLNRTPSSRCLATLNCPSNSFKFDTFSCAVDREIYGDGAEVASIVDNNVKYTVVTSFCDGYRIGYLELAKEEKIAGIKGENHPLVILVKAQSSMGNENMFVNTYRIISREIIDERTRMGYYIDFIGTPIKLEGNYKVKFVISRESSEIRAGESTLGGDLNIIKIKLEVYK